MLFRSAVNRSPNAFPKATHACVLSAIIVISRALIASQVFNNDMDKVEIAIHRLRSKIDERYLPKLIHTVGVVGYQLEVLEG